MLQLRSRDVATVPIVAHGRTVSLVSRTRTLRAGKETAGIEVARTTPLHIEVLDADGHHSVIPIRDRQLWVSMAVGAATAACMLGIRLRAWQRSKES